MRLKAAAAAAGAPVYLPHVTVIGGRAMKVGTFLLLSAVLVAVSGGCTMHKVQVSALSTSGAADKRCYTLYPCNEGVEPSDLEFQSYAEFIRRALAQRGYHEADSMDEANVGILVQYSVSDPIERVSTYSIPIFGQTGVSSSNTYGNIQSMGGNQYNYNAHTTYNPTYGVTGYSTGIDVTINYATRMALYAYDIDAYKESGAEKLIWEIRTSCEGKCSDLRRMMPVLVAASYQYFATDTGKEISVSIHERDERVKAVKGLRETP